MFNSLNSLAIHQNLKHMLLEDPEYTLFGSSQHRYTLNPPLSAQGVLSIEIENKIELPDDYRSFLIHCGNGGAGPYYGILSIQDSIYEITPDESTKTPVYIYKHFNPPKNQEESSRLTYPTDGILPIIHVGCGAMIILVCSGPERGNIWGIDAAGSYYPVNELCDDSDDPTSLFNSPGRCTFFDFYMKWITSITTRRS